MAFHRFVTPSYFGGLPAGYDLINVTSGGTGSGGSAFADGAKGGSGPNTGTYFVAWEDDATSNNANRGLRALAQNTDVLDDFLHRDIAFTVRTNDATAGSPVTTVVLPANTFLGTSGYTTSTADLNKLFEILNNSDDEIIDPTSGSHVQVTSVTLGTGDAIGGGGANGSFSGNTVQLNISPAIPASTVYRIWYGTRTNLATLPADAFTTIKIRGAEEVPAETENLFRLLHGNNEAWNANWDSTIWDLAMSGLNERYNRSTSSVGISNPEAYWPTPALNAVGGGGWFMRNGPAITGYATDHGTYPDPVNALFAAKFLNNSNGGATGFVSFGSRRSGSAWTGESLYVPGSAHFMALWPHYFQSSIHATNPYTRIQDGATASFAMVGSWSIDSGEAIIQVTQAGNYFRTGGNSSVSLGYDLLFVSYTISSVPVTATYVIVGMGSSTDPTNVTKVRVRSLDGTVPNFGAGVTGTIRWMSLTFGVGDGAGPFHATLHSDANPVLFDGLFYQQPPHLSSASDDDITRASARFSAMDTQSTSHAVHWGGYSHTAFGPVLNSFLGGDGGVQVSGADIVATGSSSSAGAVKGNYVVTKPQTPFPTLATGTPTFNFDTSLGAMTSFVLSGTYTSVTINMTNIRAGATYYLLVNYTAMTGAPPPLSWTGVTHEFSPGDDQLPPTGHSFSLWTGVSFDGTNVWWSVTHY